MDSWYLERGFSRKLLDFFQKLESALFIEKKTVREFMKITTKSAKLEFTHKWLGDKNLLPSEDSFASSGKNVEASLQARNRGNAYFQQHKYVLAMENYNEALCLAPNESESMAMAYGNRSAVFFKLGFYKFCLDNINLALENNYPVYQMNKFLDRKQACLKEIAANKRDEMHHYHNQNEMKLSHPANPQIPFVIDALKFAKNQKYGRHIVTTKTLNPGDVISVETPFFCSVRKESIYTCCFYCLKDNFMNLMPCTNSTMIMFCSETCATDAWDAYYKYEFPVADGILKNFPQVASNPFRMACKVFKLFENPEELEKYIDSIDVENEHPLSIDYSENFNLAQFRAVYCLCTATSAGHEKKSKEIFLNTCMDAMVWHLLKKYGLIGELLKNHKSEKLFLHLACHFTSIIDLNAHDYMNNFTQTTNQGTVLVPTWGLLNHSCHANTRIFNGTFGLMVTRPIKAGEQIFFSYNFLDHVYMPIERRQNILKVKYHYTCDCTACTKNYSVLGRMPVKVQPSPEILNLNQFLLHSKFFNKNVKKAVEKQIKAISKFLNQKYNLYPCKTLHNLELNLFRCLYILHFEVCEDSELSWRNDSHPLEKLCLG